MALVCIGILLATEYFLFFLLTAIHGQNCCLALGQIQEITYINTVMDE